MTPQAPKPSMHDVVTGHMYQTAGDLAAGIEPGFGATTNIINGGLECGANWENPKSEHRIDTYKKMLTYFGLPAEDEDTMGCGWQSKDWPMDPPGYGMLNYSYFTGDTCEIINTQTPYHVSTLDDYKRCICNNYGQGEPDCPLTSDPVPNPPTPNPPNPPNPGPVGITDPEEEFKDIWDKKHYDEEEKSRTLYQVDRSLDYIEKKLAEMHAVFLHKGLIPDASTS